MNQFASETSRPLIVKHNEVGRLQTVVLKMTPKALDLLAGQDLNPPMAWGLWSGAVVEDLALEVQDHQGIEF